MVTVFVPPMMRSLTDGATQVETSGRTLREVVQHLEAAYPGFEETLTEAGSLRPGLALAVNGVTQPTGLMAAVPEGGEVHILPAIGGGARGAGSAPKTRRHSW